MPDEPSFHNSWISPLSMNFNSASSATTAIVTSKISLAGNNSSAWPSHNSLIARGYGTSKLACEHNNPSFTTWVYAPRLRAFPLAAAPKLADPVALHLFLRFNLFYATSNRAPGYAGDPRHYT